MTVCGCAGNCSGVEAEAEEEVPSSTSMVDEAAVAKRENSSMVRLNSASEGSLAREEAPAFDRRNPGDVVTLDSRSSPKRVADTLLIVEVVDVAMGESIRC